MTRILPSSDLNRTIKSFVFTLLNTYHPRLRYPEGEKPADSPFLNGEKP